MVAIRHTAIDVCSEMFHLVKSWIKNWSRCHFCLEPLSNFELDSLSLWKCLKNQKKNSGRFYWVLRHAQVSLAEKTQMMSVTIKWDGTSRYTHTSAYNCSSMLFAPLQTGSMNSSNRVVCRCVSAAWCALSFDCHTAVFESVWSGAKSKDEQL